MRPQKDLLFSVTKKDLKVETFRPGGAGGQHRDKTSNAIRITHPDSGAVGQSQESRSQTENKRVALQRLIKHPKWKIWHNHMVLDAMSKVKTEDRINEMLRPKNLKVEFKENDRWIEEDRYGSD